MRGGNSFYNVWSYYFKKKTGGWYLVNVCSMKEEVNNEKVKKESLQDWHQDKER